MTAGRGPRAGGGEQSDDDDDDDVDNERARGGKTEKRFWISRRGGDVSE